MNIINKLKKVMTLALTAIILTTIFAFSGAQVEAQAVTNEVSLYYSDSVINGYRGYYEQNVYVKVSNLGYNKSVVIHYNGAEQPGVWLDEQAQYVKTLTDGSEIWTANVGVRGLLTYAIKYEVNGTTYWDNNSGNNYTSADPLGINPVVNIRPGYVPDYTACYASYPISAEVRNLNYNKVVKVRYTQDNWVTSNEQALIFGESIVGTNNEIWRTNLNIDLNNKNSFQYYIVYQVNGQTYYDNKFGTNFDTSFYCPY